MAEHGGSSRATTTVKTEIPRPALAGTGTSKEKREWTPPPLCSGSRDATSVPPVVSYSPAVMHCLKSHREEIQEDMAGAVTTLTTGRTPGVVMDIFSR